jgi:hypothetical protein
MASGQSALVLLHGLGRSCESQWREVVPVLADHLQVYAPTALGHRGGPPVQRRPLAMSDVVDAAERYLDERSLIDRTLLASPWVSLLSWPVADRRRRCAPCSSRPVVFRGRFASPGPSSHYERTNVGPPSATRLPADVQIGSFAHSHSATLPSMESTDPGPSPG